MIKDKFYWTIKTTIIGLVVFVIFLAILGTGCTRLEPFFIAFPYSFLITNYLSQGIWLMICLVFLEYPFYGFLLDKNKAHFKRTALIMAIIHIVLAIIAFQNLNSGFK